MTRAEICNVEPVSLTELLDVLGVPKADDAPTASKGDINLLTVLPGDRAIVSTKGLRRVVQIETGETLAELLTPESAESYADGFNCGRDEAVVASYAGDDVSVIDEGGA